MSISERETAIPESETQTTDPPAKREKKKKAPKIVPRFDLLDNPPPGHRITGAQIYEYYIGERIRDYFGKHGEPSLEDWMPVHRTLRAVFGGDYTREKRKWERVHRRQLST